MVIPDRIEPQARGRASQASQAPRGVPIGVRGCHECAPQEAPRRLPRLPRPNRAASEEERQVSVYIVFFSCFFHFILGFKIIFLTFSTITTDFKKPICGK